MTARTPHAGPARSASSRRPLRPPDLSQAPELASLAIVEDALHTALLALVAAHPTLEDLAAPGEPPSLRRARRLVVSAAALCHLLVRYRAAVYDALDPHPPQPDDLLF